MEPCYYFGCVDHPGHFLFVSDGSERGFRPCRWNETPEPFGVDGRKLDGGYAPGPRKADWWYPDGAYQIQSLGQLHHVDGWTVLSMWDRSVDARMGCNSSFLIRGKHTFNEMVALAAKHFPEVWKRINDAAPVREWTPVEKGALDGT